MKVQTKISASTRRTLIKAAIAKVEKADARSAKSRKRFARYRYLRIVYRVYCELEDKRLLKRLRKYLIRNYRIRDGEAHAIRIIIDATTAEPDNRLRSRWTRALEYAWNEEVSPDELLLFFRRNKGIAGCARLAARALPIGKSRRTSEDDWKDDGFLPNPPRHERERWPGRVGDCDGDTDEDDFEDQPPSKDAACEHYRIDNRRTSCRETEFGSAFTREDPPIDAVRRR